jgi:Cof subfamily protein (haloacid dehalogenase superfamily)
MTEGAGDARRPAAQRIKLLVSDVDGTLVTHDKVLTQATIDAVGRLQATGVRFAIVSSRPPRGMRMVAGPLSVPIYAGFNGGAMVGRDGTLIETHWVPQEAASMAVDALRESGADVWVFRGEDWLVTNPDGAYVPREKRTVQFDPTVVPSFEGRLDGIGKIVGSSKDFDRLARTEASLQKALGDRAAARRSQLYYLDVTHKSADKGHAVRSFAQHYGVSLEEVAVIGDMANDLPMFDIAGLAIAMGNALPDVQARADAVTASNEEDGVAEAIETIVLPRASRA